MKVAERGADGRELGEQFGDAGPPRHDARELIQQVELGLRQQQSLVLVLPVDVDEVADGLAQHRGGGEGVVDERAASALRGDFAADEDLAAVGSFNRRLDHRVVGARADEVGHGAAAEEEADGFHEDRLAGAGLAGEYGEARAELQFELVDDGESLDAEVSDHLCQGLPEPRRKSKSMCREFMGRECAPERLNNRELPRYHTFDSY